MRALFWERPKALFSVFYRHDNQAREAGQAGNYWRSLGIYVVGHLLFQRASFGFFGSLAGAMVITAGSVGVIGFSVFVATIPAEAIERWLLYPSLEEEKESKKVAETWWFDPRPFAELKADDDISLTLFDRVAWISKKPRARAIPVASEPNAVWWPTAILFEGEPDQASSKVTSLFSRNLVLVDDVDLVKLDDEQLKKADHTLLLRGRDLRYARFDRADMRKADMFEAKLAGAVLVEARLDEANLQGAELQGANLRAAQWPGADLSWAQMQGANLGDAKMQGANLSRAELQGADLSLAQLQGANLNRAQMQGANLSNAQLQGARLTYAELQGVYLGQARMEGSDLRSAHLQGANLNGAHMQGADLRGAKIWQMTAIGADFDVTQTKGTTAINPILENYSARKKAKVRQYISNFISKIPDHYFCEKAETRLL